jgi:hypothetical protein
MANNRDEWRQVSFSVPAALDEAIAKAAREHLMVEAEYVRARLIQAVQADGVKIMPAGRRSR